MLGLDSHRRGCSRILGQRRQSCRTDAALRREFRTISAGALLEQCNRRSCPNRGRC